MRTTITVDQNNIALIRKQFSQQLISALAEFGDMPADSEALHLGKFEKVFTNFHSLARIMAPTDYSRAI